MEEAHLLRAAATYNSAADTYDDPANVFWDRYGRRTIDRLQLTAGSRVLDACCGSGASAIPAALAVGPTGSVLGVDLAANLLELASLKSAKQGLHNIEFRQGDILNLGLRESSFDAVVCVFGIFFIPDVQAALKELYRLVRPRGLLAVTTWGPKFLEPASSLFWNSVRSVRPELYKGFNPWDRISQPDTLRELLISADVEVPDVSSEAGSCAIATPEDWWQMVLGTGYRGTVDQLTPEEYEQVRQENLDFIRRSAVRSVETNVIYSVAVKR